MGEKPSRLDMAKTAATDGIANLVNCGTYVKHETIKNLHYFI